MVKSVGQIAAHYRKADAVKQGGHNTVEAQPMRGGSRGSQYLSATVSDGHMLTRLPSPIPTQTARLGSVLLEGRYNGS